MNSFNNIEELIGAVGGVDESVTAEHLSDVKWRDDDPLFVFDDKNVTKPQTPAATLTPVRTCEEEDQAVSSVKSPLGKSLAFKNLLPNIYSRQLKFASNLTIMMQN